RAREHGLQERAPTRNRLNEGEVLCRDAPIFHKLIAGAVENILARGQIAERPGLLAEAAQANAVTTVHIVQRLTEVAGELLRAAHDGQGHDPPSTRCKDLLRELEACLAPAVNGLAIQKSQKLVEGGT